MFSRAAVTTGSSFSASNVQSGNGHLTFFYHIAGLTVAKLGTSLTRPGCCFSNAGDGVSR